ncbi:NAD-dependent protein deacetylase [Tessaracoccus caeni]|uniref:NAD-dependent protein deacetylase n=1 Tax=Tessaracoccus caeni TaxID=3031239 RepID=UPI0023DC893E|nr:NAD-dependent protein deacetylase [Tessaracoccus caeni]MDF1488130.1 NAD-dependent protein deacetylase [Tessaracoccus caeni]
MSRETIPDVGGWFRTARDGSVTLPAWSPGITGFGRSSSDADVEKALQTFRDRPTLVLTGAGMSTGSGLPDYRGRHAVPRSPMTYQEFIGEELSRRRYWARSFVGWQAFCRAKPNTAHLALARLGALTPITAVVTQNVDELHQAAGSRPVVDLHGRLSLVVCLGCTRVIRRADLQDELVQLNPEFAARLDHLARDAATAPDGDAEVDRTEDFRYPDCASCGGMLKPEVVFFGENARREVLSRAMAAAEVAKAVVVLGSSLTVMSGLRFARAAARDGKPVVIVNDGATRGDDLATARVHGRLDRVLSRWVQLAATRSSAGRA